MGLFYIASSLLTTISSLGLGIFVYLKAPKNATNKAWILMSISVAVWSAGFCVMVSGVFSRETTLLLDRISHVGALFISISYLYFILTLLRKAKEYARVIQSGLLCAFVFLPFIFSGLFIKDVVAKQAFKYYPVPGALYSVFTALFFIFIGIAQYLMFKNFNLLPSIVKNQVKYVIIASTLGFIGGATTFPLVYNIPIPPIGGPLVFIYVVVITYAILKFRLMDISVAVTRAGIFAFVYTLVLGLPFWLGYATKSWLVATSFAVLLATSGPYIYTYLRRRAEETLLKDQRRYQHVLRELSKNMTRIRSLEELVKAISLTVVDAVKVKFSGVYIKDDEYHAYRLRSHYPKDTQSRFPEVISIDYPLIELLIQQKRPLLSEEVSFQDKISLDSGLIAPCFIEDDLLGFIVLGAKQNNWMYTPDDVLIFETFSYSTSLAIENCIFWKEIEDRHRKARLQEMDTYSYSLAHEIDNPMQVVIGQANLLKKYMVGEVNTPEEKKKELIESFDFILEAARRVSGMVKAIRDFGQPMTGEAKPLKIQDVVESFSRLYYPQFKNSAVAFEKELPEKPIYIRGEKPELMQVLVILANNSVHALLAAKEKKISLRVECPDEARVRIIFSDNGYGIKKENLQVIFTPFTTTKASSEGTGMGLYNAKKIVERHKGKIWAESTGPEHGASFIIELPAAIDLTEEDFKKEDNKGKRLL